MRVKDPSVSLRDLKPQILFAALVVKEAAAQFGQEDCVITSANDGRHSERSLHYAGNALDFRTWDVSPEHREEFTQEVQRRLNGEPTNAVGEFDVVFEVHEAIIDGEPVEVTHLHVEYDPPG